MTVAPPLFCADGRDYHPGPSLRPFRKRGLGPSHQLKIPSEPKFEQRQKQYRPAATNREECELNRVNTCPLLKILFQQELKQVPKPRASSHDEPTRAASCTISSCRAILISMPTMQGFANGAAPATTQPILSGDRWVRVRG